MGNHLFAKKYKDLLEESLPAGTLAIADCRIIKFEVYRARPLVMRRSSRYFLQGKRTFQKLRTIKSGSLKVKTQFPKLFHTPAKLDFIFCGPRSPPR